MKYEMPDTAMAVARRAINRLGAMTSNSGTRYAQALTRYGAFLFEMEQDDQALQAMDQAIALYQSAGQANSLPMAMARCQLARMQSEVGLDAEAVKNAQWAADYLLSTEGKHGKHYRLAQETLQALTTHEGDGDE